MTSRLQDWNKKSAWPKLPETSYYTDSFCTLSPLKPTNTDPHLVLPWSNINTLMPSLFHSHITHWTYVSPTQPLAFCCTNIFATAIESHATILILLVADVIVSDLYEATIIGCFLFVCGAPFFASTWIRKRASRVIWTINFFLGFFKWWQLGVL